MPKLSIIIPCYNCEKTLREAVDSCYLQDLTETEFEIIMVDDGSTDGTRSLMEELAMEHSNIRLISHPENRGGGAARNTGIKEAEGEIIYCLDSDNVFAPKSVKPMLSYLHDTKADGVAFYERRFFVGNNKKRYSSHFNSIVKQPIQLTDILNGSGTLLDNFFYTKAAYNETSGYPEHHGFDTQCFEMRFLSAGHTVKICPDSLFWHRQAGGQKSYFERVYESGEYSLNMYYVLEDIMHLLSLDARRLILDFDVFSQTKLGKNNLLDTLVEKFKGNEAVLFQANHKKYIGPEGQKHYCADNGETDLLVNALCLLRDRRYEQASIALLKECVNYPDSLILQFNLLRCAAGMRKIEPSQIERQALKSAQRFALRRQTINLNPSIIKMMAIKLKNILR